MYEEKEVILGGKKQVIALEGRDDGAVMIMLHGGPWGPVIYGHAYRGYYPALYENAGIVWWDQYGCGRNHSDDIPKDIVVEDFAKMAVDLVEAVHEMFPNRKLILNGNSFGSYLALYAAHEKPRLVNGVICLGPILDMQQAMINFEEAAKSHYTAKESKMVENLRKQKDIKFFMLVAGKLAEKYTNCAHYKGREAHDSMTPKWILRLLTSKDLSTKDFIATMKMSSTPGKDYDALWNSLLDIDLRQMLSEMKSMPMLFLQGSEELYVLPQVLEKLSEEMPNIKYIKYNHCGHIPTAESFPQMLGESVRFALEC